jgi:N-acetyl-gamma-glutamyl-phosphate reductase
MTPVIALQQLPTAPATTPRTRLSAGIAGASGYAGRELARILSDHPVLRLAMSQARSEGYAPLDADQLALCDVVFLALPHGQSAEMGSGLRGAGTPVVDLGSDFRLDGDWAYGLPELFREEIAASSFVANPGCYATAALLALAPLVEAGLADPPIVIDGKSGVSGAGRTPTERTHLCEVDGGVQPYTPVGHRHISEIERSLGRLADADVPVTFTPHLAPHARGLEVTCYVRLSSQISQGEAEALYHARYAGEPFVDVVQSAHPARLHGANGCHLGIWVDARTRTAIVAAAIDNLGKGAAGQAVQNANLILGLPETAGLTARGIGL